MTAQGKHWYLNVGGTRYPAIDGSESISCELKRLNVGKITISTPTAPVAVGTAVMMEVYDGSTYTVKLDGYVKKYSIVSKPRAFIGGVTGDKWVCKYEMAERASELEQTRMMSAATSYPDKLIYTSTAGTMKSVVTSILALSCSTWTVAPGNPAGDSLPSMRFQNTTVLAGLQKLVVDMGNSSGGHYWLWFETTPGVPGGIVYWGTYRTDYRSLTSYTDINATQFDDIKNNNKKVVDGVLVTGFNDQTMGIYPASPVSNNIAVYAVPTATSNAECAILAQNFYNDYLKDPERRVQFKCTPDNALVSGVEIQEGDYITVKGETFVIVDMFYTPKDIQVGCTTGDISVAGALGDGVQATTGTISTETMITTPSMQAVCSAASPAIFWVDIPDKTKIANYKVSTKFDKYQKSFTPGTFTPVIGEAATVSGQVPNAKTPLTMSGNTSTSITQINTPLAYGGSTDYTTSSEILGAGTCDFTIAHFNILVAKMWASFDGESTDGSEQQIHIQIDYRYGDSGAFSIAETGIFTPPHPLTLQDYGGLWDGTTGNNYLTEAGGGADTLSVRAGEILMIGGYYYVVDYLTSTRIYLYTTLRATTATTPAYRVGPNAVYCSIVALIPGTDTSQTLWVRAQIHIVDTTSDCTPIILRQSSATIYRYPVHTHSMTSTTHEHSVTDTGSTGADTDTPTVISSLPTNVQGTLTKPGGSTQALGAFSDGTELDITSYLTENGKYKISFSSTDAGIIHLTTVYGQY